MALVILAALFIFFLPPVLTLSIILGAAAFVVYIVDKRIERSTGRSILRQIWQKIRGKKTSSSSIESEDDLVTVVKKEINAFRSFRKHSTEEPYQMELGSHLRAKLSNLNVEIERRDPNGRPDIIVANIAIEVKGPTLMYDLNSIPSKCIRYQKNYAALIVVLFDVQVTDTQYQEWEQDISEHFPRVVIIRK